MLKIKWLICEPICSWYYSDTHLVMTLYQLWIYPLSKLKYTRKAQHRYKTPKHEVHHVRNIFLPSTSTTDNLNYYIQWHSKFSMYSYCVIDLDMKCTTWSYKYSYIEKFSFNKYSKTNAAKILLPFHNKYDHSSKSILSPYYISALSHISFEYQNCS